ncbi:MAG: hypothetical protein LR001_03520 [Clostridiales bacterium]|nr:hypothetical protein [Clostridiales bacterium]
MALEKYGFKCVMLKNFEKLKNTSGLYSMRLKGEVNLRILFCFFDFGYGEIALLLYPFQEKDNKKSNKDSYRTAIPIANSRKEDVGNRIK